MSCALDGDELDIAAIHAFLDGYRTQRDFPEVESCGFCACCGLWKAVGGSRQTWTIIQFLHRDLLTRWTGWRGTWALCH